MTISKRSEELLSKATCGVNASKRNDLKLKIRIFPYVEVRSKDVGALEQLRVELLGLSIGSTVMYNRFLRVQGIQNCNLISAHIKPPKWWLEALSLFLTKRHCQRSGIQEILQLRPNERNNRLSDDEIVQQLMDFE